MTGSCDDMRPALQPGGGHDEHSCQRHRLGLQPYSLLIPLQRPNMEEEDQAASGLHTDTGKIDMSLDDIIKLQNEETTTHLVSIPTRPRDRANHFQSRNGFRGKERNQQGSNRPKFGFKQGYSGMNPRNNQTGPVTRRRAATINRANLVNQQNITNTKSTPNRSQTQARHQQEQKRFRPTAVSVQGLTKRVNVQTRRTQFNSAQRGRRLNTLNQGRRLTQQFTPGKRQPNARRWQTDKGFGSTLTVSVLNRAANQGQRPGMKRPGLRFRRPAVQPKTPIPKGVPLRFNFRAMANHTNVTLNERFSTLNIRGRFSPARRGGGRTVMLA